MALMPELTMWKQSVMSLTVNECPIAQSCSTIFWDGREARDEISGRWAGISLTAEFSRMVYPFSSKRAAWLWKYVTFHTWSTFLTTNFQHDSENIYAATPVFCNVEQLIRIVTYWMCHMQYPVRNKCGRCFMEALMARTESCTPRVSCWPKLLHVNPRQCLHSTKLSF